MARISKKQLLEDFAAAEKNIDALNEEILELEDDVIGLEDELEDLYGRALSAKENLKGADRNNLGVAGLAAVDGQIGLIEDLFDDL